MGKTRYAAIIEMLSEIPDEIVHLNVLKFHIQTKIATKEPAVSDILRTMEEMGLIQETETPFKYRLLKDGKV